MIPINFVIRVSDFWEGCGIFATISRASCAKILSLLDGVPPFTLALRLAGLFFVTIHWSEETPESRPGWCLLGAGAKLDHVRT
jgi:hypothetical protein